MIEKGSSDLVKRILVLAPNWLGDVIMAAPLLTYLREVSLTSGKQSLEIILGIRRIWAPLFADDPRLDGTMILERNGKHAGVAGLFRQARNMRALDVDAVLLGPPSLRAGLAAHLAGIRRRIGYRSDVRDWLLSDGLPVMERGSAHYTHEMLLLGNALLRNLDLPESLVDETGADSDGPPDFDPGLYLPGCRDWVAAESGSGAPLWAVAPGTTFGQAKTWPAGRVGEFLDLAVRGRGRRVVLLGDASCRDFCQLLRHSTGLPWREELSGPPAVIDRTGKTDLPGVVKLLKASEGFVGNDSGLMHLAGALGIPTVGIFGSSNPRWTAPAGPSTAIVFPEGYPCRPCYRPTCNQPKFCLEDIPAFQVIGVLEGLLEAASQRGAS